MPDEDFTSIEAALQVVEKFASRLTVGDAEGHVRRSVDELCAAVTKRLCSRTDNAANNLTRRWVEGQFQNWGSDLMSFSRPELRFNFGEQVHFQLPRPVALIASRGEAVKELAGLASVNLAQGIVLSGHAAASIDRRLKLGIPIRNRALLILR